VVKKIPLESIKVNGNELCLNFLNTIHHRYKPPVASYINDFEDLLYWASKKVGIITEEERQSFPRGGAEAFYKEAMDLRAVLDDLFYRIAKKEPYSFDAFNVLFHYYNGHQKMMPGPQLGWDWAAGDFHRLTAPIVRSASDLLLSPRLSRVGLCSGCGWLFLDATKNGKRRWCSMEECGSAAKAREYYHRHKSDD